MPGTGYTSIAQYLDANRDTLDAERAALAGGVGDKLTGAQTAADKVIAGVAPQSDPTAAPGYFDALMQQQAAQESAQGLGSYGGLADLTRQRYGDSTNQAGFDASLLVGSPAFGPVRDRAGTLTDYLEKGTQAAAAKPLPTPPPPSQDVPPKDPDTTPPGGPGPSGGDERDLEKRKQPPPWTFPPSSGQSGGPPVPKEKSRGR